MKKALLLFLALALLLCGCSAKADSGVSAYVSPESFGGDELLASTPPSAALPKREKLKLTLPVYLHESADEASGVGTDEMRYRLEWPYFMGEEFSFLVPAGWNAGNFELDINTSSSGTRQFLFYLLDSESSLRALVLKIDCMAIDGDIIEYGTTLGETYDGKYRYVRAAVTGELPEDFADFALYGTISEELYSEGFDFQVNI